jgi:hypothetical protein
VFPFYPLLLAGLWTELRNVWTALCISWCKPARGDRCAAFIGAGMLASIALFVACSTAYGLFRFLPDLFSGYRHDFESRRPAYAWIAGHTAPGASVFAYDDPLLYLYTGRKACGMPIPPKLYFHNDDAGIDRLLHTIPQFARQYHLDYALLTTADFYRDLREHGAEHLAEAVESSGAFERLYRTGGVSIYRYAGGEVHNSRYDTTRTPAASTASRTSGDVSAASSSARLSFSRVRAFRSSSVQ